jgi:hypothetical protein
LSSEATVVVAPEIIGAACACGTPNAIASAMTKRFSATNASRDFTMRFIRV